MAWVLAGIVRFGVINFESQLSEFEFYTGFDGDDFVRN